MLGIMKELNFEKIATGLVISLLISTVTACFQTYIAVKEMTVALTHISTILAKVEQKNDDLELRVVRLEERQQAVRE